MKTKRRFKKSLAVLLAAVLALSSMWGITAFAATDQEVNTLETRISDYEKLMNETVAPGMAEGKAYTGLEEAYELYIEAKAVYDAYTYGKNDELEGVGDLADQLDTATRAITIWQDDGAMTFDADAYHASEVAVGGYSNLIYATSDQAGDNTVWRGTSASENKAVTYCNFDVKIAEPATTVYAYDGKNDTYGPVLFEELTSSSNGTQIIYSVFPGDGETYRYNDTEDYPSTGDNDRVTENYPFELRQNWLGYTDGGYKKDGVTSSGNTKDGYLIWPGDYVTEDGNSYEKWSIQSVLLCGSGLCES